MSSEIDELAGALADLSGREGPENAQLVPPGQRPCPICGRHMQVEQFSGVPIDVCRDHGLWLDVGELPTILAQARSGERRRRLHEIREARQKGKVSGTIFGIWSLLWE